MGWTEGTKNPKTFNIIRLVAGSMGQISHRPVSDVPSIIFFSITLKIDGFLMLVRQQTVPLEGQRPGVLMGAPCPLPVKRSIKAKEIKSSRPIPNRVKKVSTNG